MLPLDRFLSRGVLLSDTCAYLNGLLLCTDCLSVGVLIVGLKLSSVVFNLVFFLAYALQILWNPIFYVFQHYRQLYEEKEKLFSSRPKEKRKIRTLSSCFHDTNTQNYQHSRNVKKKHNSTVPMWINTNILRNKLFRNSDRCKQYFDPFKFLQWH